MLDDAEFRKLVGRMREAQLEFFKTRKGDVLQRAKDLEKQVDDSLREAGLIDDGQMEFPF